MLVYTASVSLFIEILKRNERMNDKTFSMYHMHMKKKKNNRYTTCIWSFVQAYTFFFCSLWVTGKALQSLESFRVENFSPLNVPKFSFGDPPHRKASPKFLDFFVAPVSKGCVIANSPPWATTVYMFTVFLVCWTAAHWRLITWVSPIMRPAGQHQGTCHSSVGLRGFSSWCCPLRRAGFVFRTLYLVKRSCIQCGCIGLLLHSLSLVVIFFFFRFVRPFAMWIATYLALWTGTVEWYFPLSLTITWAETRLVCYAYWHLHAVKRLFIPSFAILTEIGRHVIVKYVHTFLTVVIPCS